MRYVVGYFRHYQFHETQKTDNLELAFFAAQELSAELHDGDLGVAAIYDSETEWFSRSIYASREDKFDGYDFQWYDRAAKLREAEEKEEERRNPTVKHFGIDGKVTTMRMDEFRRFNFNKPIETVDELVKEIGVDATIKLADSMLKDKTND